jgi:hypothetical protein
VILSLILYCWRLSQFLRYADAKEVSQWRREGLIDARLLREAKRILEEERKFAKEVE